MENYIIVAVVFAIVIAIIVYLARSKKRGDKCIGCPYAKQCRQSRVEHKKVKKG